MLRACLALAVLACLAYAPPAMAWEDVSARTLAQPLAARLPTDFEKQAYFSLVEDHAPECEIQPAVGKTCELLSARSNNRQELADLITRELMRHGFSPEVRTLAEMFVSNLWLYQQNLPDYQMVVTITTTVGNATLGNDNTKPMPNAYRQVFKLEGRLGNGLYLVGARRPQGAPLFEIDQLSLLFWDS